MTTLSDLVNDAKLKVQFHTDYVSHEVLESSTEYGTRIRRRRKEEQWRREKHLGEGGYGMVWLESCVSDSPTKLRAVKRVPKTSYSTGAIDYTPELEAMAKFSQRKLSMTGFLSDRSDGLKISSRYISLWSSYFELGDLQKHLVHPLPEVDAQQISYQILEGLEHLHANGYAHRDLKPANIFVVQKSPNWWVKIGDFGISKRLRGGDTAFRTIVGTETHLAPEVLLNRYGGSQEYTRMVDMWSLGVMTHYILTRTLPFQTSAELSAYTQNHHFPSSALQSHGVSREGHDFTKALLAVDPAARLVAKDALEHAWVKIDFEVPFTKSQQGQTDDYTPSPLESQNKAQLSVNSPDPSGRWSDRTDSTPPPQELDAIVRAVEPGTVQWQPRETEATIRRPQGLVVVPRDFSTRFNEHGKLTIVGDESCGKTSLLSALSEGTFKETHFPTVSANNVVDVEVDGKHVQLTLCDTSGQGAYDRFRRLSYPDSHVVLICFAIDSPDSLENVQDKWISEVLHFCQNVPIILVGCKKDLRFDPMTIESLRTPSALKSSQGEEVRKRIGGYKYIECSARTGEGVNEVFEAATRASLFMKSHKSKKWWRRIL